MKLCLTLALLTLTAAVRQGSYKPMTKEEIDVEFPKIPNEYIVVFKDGVPEEHVQAHLAAVKGMDDAEVRKEWHIYNPGADSFRGYHVAVQDEKPGSALDFIKSRFGNEVKIVEQNTVVKASKTRKAKAACTMQSGATWGLVRTATRTNDENGYYSYGSDGAGVTAYVIDTGIRCSHEEFAGRCTWGEDFANFPSPETDLNGHGTHVAGTIGGNLYGLAKKANLVAVAVLSASGSGSTAGVISGVEWATNDAKGKKAVGNMSLGGGYSAASNEAVNAAYASGLAMFVASGNSDTDSCSFSPASAVNAFTVDSSDSNDERSTFSNYGACSNIVAPGSAISSAWINSDSSTLTISGTSMASPHVAGVAAKLLSEQSYTPAELYNAIVNNASPGVISGFPSSPQSLLYMDCEGSRAWKTNPFVKKTNLRTVAA